jgi:hypothetical protein
MGDLAKWPELEHLANPLDPEGAAITPVEIRFAVRPDPGEKWGKDLAAECTVGGQPAPSPGAALSFQQWEKDAEPTYYCYALARNVKDGDTVTLRVRSGKDKAETVWEKEFHVHAEGGSLELK